MSVQLLSVALKHQSASELPGEMLRTQSTGLILRVSEAPELGQSILISENIVVGMVL